MKKRKKIALLIESSRAYGRGVILGIANFAHAHDNWLMFHHERLLSEGIPDWFEKLNPDGVIVRTDNRSAYEKVIARNIPTVDLRATYNDESMYVVETNDELVAQMAADHLLVKGHRRFAFCGFAGANYSVRRLKFFRSYLASKGLDVHVYETEHEIPGGDASAIVPEEEISTIESSCLVAEPKLTEWLESLPKPIGVMACNDARGTQILNICRSRQIVVPEEVSVISVDDDDVICNLADPPLTSVKNNTRLIGYRAAEIMQSMFLEQPIAKRVHLIAPTGVEVRVSTETTAISDQLVAQALFYIREHACEGISVADVVTAVPVSRATLERRFRAATNRSINEEISRVKIARIKQLLIETDLKLSAIARMTGFNHTEYMASLFKKESGITPGQYRRNNTWD